MGMFDYVDYKDTKCPYCTEELVTKHDPFPFQSKDADCNLEVVTPDKVKNFYTTCPSCSAFVSYNVLYLYKVELDPHDWIEDKVTKWMTPKRKEEIRQMDFGLVYGPIKDELLTALDEQDEWIATQKESNSNVAVELNTLNTRLSAAREVVETARDYRMGQCKKEALFKVLDRHDEVTK